jgi:hypothetical protein
MSVAQDTSLGRRQREDALQQGARKKPLVNTSLHHLPIHERGF